MASHLTSSILVSRGRERRLRRGKPCHRNPEWRTGNVIESGLMTKTYGIWIAAMLAADAELNLRPRLAPALDGDFHKLAHAISVDADEGIAVDQSTREIFAQEASRIVAGHAKRRLRQIVGAEGEEFRRFCYLFCHEGGTRQLDHRADHIGWLFTASLFHRVRDRGNALLQ